MHRHRGLEALIVVIVGYAVADRTRTKCVCESECVCECVSECEIVTFKETTEWTIIEHP
jgi:hypothetical protein